MLWQYFGAPVGYIQQVVVRAAVLPLDTRHSLASDTLLKATLSTVFDVVEHVENFQLHNGWIFASLSENWSVCVIHMDGGSYFSHNRDASMSLAAKPQMSLTPIVKQTALKQTGQESGGELQCDFR